MTQSPTASDSRGSAHVRKNKRTQGSSQYLHLRGIRLKELDREFNRQSKQLALLAKKLKSRIVLKSD